MHQGLGPHKGRRHQRTLETAGFQQIGSGSGGTLFNGSPLIDAHGLQVGEQDRDEDGYGQPEDQLQPSEDPVAHVQTAQVGLSNNPRI